MKVVISPDGEREITVIAHADLQAEIISAFGDVTNVRRIGHVVPAHPWKRLVFRLLRRMFTGTHPVANWTRRWSGKWLVTVDGNQIGPEFGERRDAIAYEENFAVRERKNG